MPSRAKSWVHIWCFEARLKLKLLDRRRVTATVLHVANMNVVSSSLIGRMVFGRTAGLRSKHAPWVRRRRRPRSGISAGGWYSDELRVCIANTLRGFAAAGARAAESHRDIASPVHFASKDSRGMTKISVSMIFDAGCPVSTIWAMAWK